VFLDEGVVPRSTRQDNHNELGAQLSKYLVVRPGDIVFNKLRTWQGGLGVSRFEGIVSPAYFVCRPLPIMDSIYMHYLLRSEPYRQELTRLSKWMPPAQFDIAWDLLRVMPTPVPPRADQRAIAKFLDVETARNDTLIAKKRRLGSLVERRWQMAVRAAADEWPKVALRRLSQVIDCKHRTPAYINRGFPVVSPGDVTAGRLDLRRCHRFVDADELADLTEGVRRPRWGDIVYSRNASIGIAAFVDTDRPFTMGQDVCLIRSESQDPLWLTYMLNSVGIDQLQSVKIGSTFDRVNIAQLLDLEIPLPPMEVQRAVSRELDEDREAIERLQGSLTHQIGCLQERRQALITAAVTGQLEIPGVSAA